MAIFDHSGKFVHVQEITAGESVPVSEFVPGVYLFQLKTESATDVNGW